MHSEQTNATSLEARARRRVGIKLGFYTHALVYVLVNLGLFVVDSASGGQRWSHFPLLGWGLGLAIHGAVAFLSLQGQGVRERMLASEVERLRRQA
jgi:2TM domain